MKNLSIPAAILCLVLAAPGTAQTVNVSENPVTAAALDGGVNFSEDLCQLTKSCLPGDAVGITTGPQAKLLPPVGVERLKQMLASSAGSEDERTAYADGLSDATIIDWCSICNCCAINHDGLTIDADALLNVISAGRYVVIQGE